MNLKRYDPTSTWSLFNDFKFRITVMHIVFLMIGSSVIVTSKVCDELYHGIIFSFCMNAVQKSAVFARLASVCVQLHLIRTLLLSFVDDSILFGDTVFNLPKHYIFLRMFVRLGKCRSMCLKLKLYFSKTVVGCLIF